jgi:hypothetical protein
MLIDLMVQVLCDVMLHHWASSSLCFQGTTTFRSIRTAHPVTQYHTPEDLNV